MPLRVLVLILLCVPALGDDDWRCWQAPHRAAHQAYEKELVDAVDATSLRNYHSVLAGRPHRAGTEGDLAVVEYIARVFADAGLEVEKQELRLYLAKPVSGELEVVAPERVKLAVKEEPVDEYSKDPALDIGWNAFSGSGEAVGEVVYANYGRKEDFAKLRELGIDIKGKIVIARYGGNFRGYKAKFAEAGGAAGLVIYTDPHDAGYFRGLGWPEGGYANLNSIQRGSILTLPYRGDPLTPNVPATKDAKRLDPGTIAFPKIPVQPVGWKAAQEILKRMKGKEVLQEWQGALPFRYRLTGGPDLRVRIKVEQKRELTRTFNVTGTLRGAKFPKELIVVGSHHDAWCHGAGDPTAGTMLVLEAARCFAQSKVRPARTIIFAAWAAEEFGIMGSTEWVEHHRDRLSQNCIAYLNLDMAAMGPVVRSSCAPALKTLMNACVKAETGKGLDTFGNLGGGSDHIGFYCHLAIPSASLGGGGTRGTSYHTLYDNLAWYRRIVGEDYAPAAKLTHIVNRFAVRLANADLLPLDPARVVADMRGHVQDLTKKFTVKLTKLDTACKTFAEVYPAAQDEILERLGEFDPAQLARLNALLLGLERQWIHRPGLPGRPWYRNLYAAADEDSGYAAWMLPGLRRAAERGDAVALEEAARIYGDALMRFGEHFQRMTRVGR